MINSEKFADIDLIVNTKPIFKEVKFPRFKNNLVFIKGLSCFDLVFLMSMKITERLQLTFHIIKRSSNQQFLLHPLPVFFDQPH